MDEMGLATHGLRLANAPASEEAFAAGRGVDFLVAFRAAEAAGQLGEVDLVDRERLRRAPRAAREVRAEIGRASCRERV